MTIQLGKTGGFAGGVIAALFGLRTAGAVGKLTLEDHPRPAQGSLISESPESFNCFGELVNENSDRVIAQRYALSVFADFPSPQDGVAARLYAAQAFRRTSPQCQRG